MAVSGDCNDLSAVSNPSAPEICDGLDNDCDGLVDEGFVTVAGSLELTADHTGQTVLLSWTPAGGVKFDVLSGDIEFLKTFQSFTYSCQLYDATNLSATTFADARLGPSGHPVYYLVRGYSCSGAVGSWSSGAPSERPGRDGELSVPHGSCP